MVFMNKYIAFIVSFAFLAVAILWLNSNQNYVASINLIEGPRQAENMQFTNAPEFTINQDKKYTAEIKTTEGTMTFELLVSEAPNTVNNFVFLANKDFYKNTFFHRVIENFMIQGGDPTGTGTGGPGYAFNDETITRDYIRGTLAMANAGPNTNGSQFFIVHKDVGLPKDYTIFGTLISGEEVLDKIAQGNVYDNGSGEISTPTNKTYINSVVITEE